MAEGYSSYPMARIAALPHALSEPHDRLRWARQAAGFHSPTEAADHFGWNANTYKSTENGIRGLTKAKAISYGRGLKVPSAWLLLNEGDPFKPSGIEETELLVMFRGVGPELQRSIIAMVRSLFGENTPK